MRWALWSWIGCSFTDRASASSSCRCFSCFCHTLSSPGGAPLASIKGFVTASKYRQNIQRRLEYGRARTRTTVESVSWVLSTEQDESSNLVMSPASQSLSVLTELYQNHCRPNTWSVCHSACSSVTSQRRRARTVRNKLRPGKCSSCSKKLCVGRKTRAAAKRKLLCSGT